MIIVRAGVTALLAVLALVGCKPAGPAPQPPTNGTVVKIVPDSASCADKAPETVGVLYQPSGVDSTGSRWPQSVLCVTPEVASGLSVDGQVWK